MFRPQDSVDLGMPGPHQFNSCEEYTVALRSWYTRAQRFFGFALLPVPVSGLFHLPEPPKIFTKEEKSDAGRFRTFKANQWPLLPENYLDMLSRVLTGAAVPPDESFAHQIPKREVIYYKHHLSASPQPLADLLPWEPLPHLYDTYADYERPFRNWASLCHSSLLGPLIPVREFESIVAIDIFSPLKKFHQYVSAVDSRLLQVGEVCGHPRRFQVHAPAVFPFDESVDHSDYCEGLRATMRSAEEGSVFRGLRCEPDAVHCRAPDVRIQR
jgi:hypothetical protein